MLCVRCNAPIQMDYSREDNESMQRHVLDEHVRDVLKRVLQWCSTGRLPADSDKIYLSTNNKKMVLDAFKTLQTPDGMKRYSVKGFDEARRFPLKRSIKQIVFKRTEREEYLVVFLDFDQESGEYEARMQADSVLGEDMWKIPGDDTTIERLLLDEKARFIAIIVSDWCDGHDTPHNDQKIYLNSKNEQLVLISLGMIQRPDPLNRYDVRTFATHSQFHWASYIKYYVYKKQGKDKYLTARLEIDTASGEYDIRILRDNDLGKRMWNKGPYN